MHKVIVECYRENHWPNSGGRRANIPLEDLPAKEGMKAGYSFRKDFGENLSPLRRWLRSQTGRPWDDVYGEACEVIKPNSAVRNHIKIHLLEMVHRNTFVRHGQVWCFRESFWGQIEEMPIGRACSRWNPFFVHPESRKLCDSGSSRSRFDDARLADAKRASRSADTQWVAETEVLRKVKGIWYRCHVRAWGRDRRGMVYDAAEKSEITSSTAWQIYRRAVVCVAKKQLSRKELAKYGLKND